MKLFRIIMYSLFLLVVSGLCEPAHAEFISLEKKSDVWWFKSPSGKQFLSIGINHVEPVYWQSPNNKAFVLDTYGQLFSTDGVFLDGSPAADNWAQRVAANLKNWGFNTLGVHNPLSKSLHSQGQAYYVVELDLHVPWGWNMSRPAMVHAFRKRPFDVFDDAFVVAVKSNAAEVVKAFAGDPRVLGYAYTDGPPWTVDDNKEDPGYGTLSNAEKNIHPWVLALMSLPAEAKGKQVWLLMLKERYSSPEQAGTTYGLNISNWDEMGSKTVWTSISDTLKAEEDSQAFLERIMRQWYEVRRNAIRMYDQNHLILGDKLNMNRDSRYPAKLVKSLKIMKDYVDLINIQYYAPFDKQRDTLALLYKETQKPVLTGDTACCPLWKDPTPDNTDYYSQLGQTYSNDVTKLFSLPYFIGWHHCGYMRGLRPPYVNALKRGDKKACAHYEKNKNTYREGFFTELEEPIDLILKPLNAAILNCEIKHRASGMPEKVD